MKGLPALTWPPSGSPQAVWREKPLAVAGKTCQLARLQWPPLSPPLVMPLSFNWPWLTFPTYPVSPWSQCIFPRPSWSLLCAPPLSERYKTPCQGLLRAFSEFSFDPH